ncbi:MAG TPA: hypothetical protein VMB80_06300 [Candidatus Acidoferrum sp.]|nr:hypothetical protein [Candidatus Acidoferrum sp.]
MKILIPVIVVLLALFCVLVLGLDRSERRAQFISTTSQLNDANRELQLFGVFTNHIRNARVYPYTNLFTIQGTNYQCALALECDLFRERGFLTITTNGLYVWVDKQRGLVLLGRPRVLPPGF